MTDTKKGPSLMTKADKALASMLAAATLVGGVAPAALADDQTPAPNPDSGTTAPITTDRLDKTIENAHAVDLTRDWTKTTKEAFDTSVTNSPVSLWTMKSFSPTHHRAEASRSGSCSPYQSSLVR